MIGAAPWGEYHLWCDTLTCPYGIRVQATNRNDALQAAAARGWTHTQGQDHCPDCTNEHAPGDQA